MMNFRNWLEQSDASPMFNCGGCGHNLIANREYGYMLHSDIWEKIGNPKNMRCVGCVEKELGRRLRKNDFNWDLPLTKSKRLRSNRLKDRMGISEK
jgi:hypothetical protein